MVKFCTGIVVSAVISWFASTTVVGVPETRTGQTAGYQKIRSDDGRVVPMQMDEDEYTKLPNAGWFRVRRRHRVWAEPSEWEFVRRE